MARLSQKMFILAYMQKNKSVSLSEAIYDLGVAALSQRIGELGREGHIIRHENVPFTARLTGNPGYYGRYTLIETNDEAPTARQLSEAIADGSINLDNLKGRRLF